MAFQQLRDLIGSFLDESPMQRTTFLELVDELQALSALELDVAHRHLLQAVMHEDTPDREAKSQALGRLGDVVRDQPRPEIGSRCAPQAVGDAG